jgi:threonine aldolase
MAYDWPGADVRPDEVLVRLVTSWATRADEVERFLGIVG